MAKILGGYQPDTKSSSARRADFDLRRRIAKGGFGIGEGTVDQPMGIYSGTSTPLPTALTEGESWVVGTPVPTAAPPNPAGGSAQAGDIIVWNGSSWVNMGTATGPTGPTGPRGPQGPPGPEGPTGPEGTDEVWVGPAAPVTVTQELWVDTDAVSPTGGSDEVWIGATTPVATTLELWVDVDEEPSGGGTDEVWIGATTPVVSTLELWVDVDEDPSGGGGGGVGVGNIDGGDASSTYGGTSPVDGGSA